MSGLSLLEINQLVTEFRMKRGVFNAVDGVSFHLDVGETLGLVGESGSGKSITALSILQLIPNPPGRIVGGSINFNGENLLNRTGRQMQSIRGNEISMIFQEPMTSLNPVFTIGNQLAEVFLKHEKCGKQQAFDRSVELLERVEMPSAKKRMSEYPYQLSGGMRQRVMIAMAMACNPKLLIADEPTTALDVTIQAQILNLMIKVREEFDTSILLITHDMGIVAEMAHRVVVMYAGKVVEQADVKSIFHEPLHPYTQALLRSIPPIDRDTKRLQGIIGKIPQPFEIPQGCRFSPRCDQVNEKCFIVEPPCITLANRRQVSCWLYEGQMPEEDEV